VTKMNVDVHIPHGGTMKLGRVEGGLRAGNNARIRASDGNLVVVTGDAQFDGNAVIECDFECENLNVERAGMLLVTGNLTVHHVLDVSNSIRVDGLLTAEGIDVGGRVNSRSVSCKRMRVGGTAEVAESLKADSVEVGGKIEARGTVDLGDLQVGGKAEIGGGSISGVINVGGKFESSSALRFGELQVFGVGTLGAGSKGGRITASGKLEAKGDLECDRIESAGIASVSGDLKAITIDAKGKLKVTGSLSSSESLDVYGTTEVGKAFSGGSLRVSGGFSAKSAIVAGHADARGQVETQKGLKAKLVSIRGGRCTGPIIAETVEVGDSGPGFSAFAWGQRLRIQAGTCQVEDVYASRVVVGAGSRAGRIFAETVELGSGCDVEEVTYVKELKVAGHVKIVHPVKKVDKLQEPPL
jgi:cytoskeletal protein CcmA (bactofilin family)